MLPALLFMGNALAQKHTADLSQKHYRSEKITGIIKIDGKLTEPEWQAMPLGTGFIELKNDFGRQQAFNSRSEFRLASDEFAIYVGGFCHESSKDSITREFVGRDVVGNNDFIGVIFDTYHDKINGFGFFVTCLGEQFDCKYSQTNGEDGSWNAVWESATEITDSGWAFEMKIPWSALRYSPKIDTWGFNVFRKRVKAGLEHTWNPVDPKVNGFINQFGTINGITHDKAPLRLSFSPYFSTYVSHYPYDKAGIAGEKNTTTSINGGMDVKWGIDENYTLDMTLIPDFGQVQSDRRILNLTPFEVQYQENRQFFTEGTELFNKGNLFYSRRVGGFPLNFNLANSSLDTHEVVLRNPIQSKLLNATKISGRNSKGLALGFFNAVAQPVNATISDTLTGHQHLISTSPLTNYNIVVADQSLKNNSSVSLINTSVWRSGADYDATVTAAVLNFNNKKNTYYLNFNPSLSNKFYTGKTQTGYAHRFSIGKSGGNFVFEIAQNLLDSKFDKNDLGILFNNNVIENGAFVGYRWRKPTNWYNYINVNLNGWYEPRYTDLALQAAGLEINNNLQFKNLMRSGHTLFAYFPANDFYEPRTVGYNFIKPRQMGGEIWWAANEAKKYYSDFALKLRYSKLPLTEGAIRGNYYYLGWGNRYRFNERLTVNTNFTTQTTFNDAGFAYKGQQAGDIVFSRRNVTTAENTLFVRYNFNKFMGLSLDSRHYWSRVVPKQYYNLQTSGRLQPSAASPQDDAYSFNLFNIDMVYFWQFAPGSFINLVWKNAIEGTNDAVSEKYFYNLRHTLTSYQANTVSLKVIYYIDYFEVQQKLKQRKKP